MLILWATALEPGQKKRDSRESPASVGCAQMQERFLEEIVPICISYSVDAVIDARQIKDVARCRIKVAFATDSLKHSMHQLRLRGRSKDVRVGAGFDGFNQVFIRASSTARTHSLVLVSTWRRSLSRSFG